MKKVKVNDINFNAEHYLALGRDAGVEALAKDHENNDQAKDMDWDKVFDAFEAEKAKAEEAK